VGVEQVATSQIEWYHEFHWGTTENAYVGGLLDLATARAVL